MLGEGVFPIVAGDHRAGAKLFGGLGALFRHHVDRVPGGIVLAVLYESQIEGPDLLSDFLEAVVVTAISCIVYSLIRRDESKAGVEGLVLVKEAAGEMAGRQHVDREVLVDGDRRPPIFLMNFGKRVAPFLIVTAIAQPRHHVLHLRLDGADEVIIQVIPMVMGQHHHVDVIGNILGPIEPAPVHGLVDPGNRRGVEVVDGVDQNFLSVKLHIKRRVPHPNDYVLVRREGFEVGLCGNHSALRDRYPRRRK